MSITNLTNTSWYFNEKLVSCGIGSEDWHLGMLNAYWEVDINWYDTQFSSLGFELPREDGWVGISGNQMWYETGDGTNVMESQYQDVGDGGTGWRYEAFRTITITGGADVEDPDLITWLTSNATQVEDPHPTHDTNKHCLVFSSPTDFTLEAIEEGSDHLGRDPEMGGVEPWTTNKGYWDGILLYSTDGLHWSEWYGGYDVLSSIDGKLYLRGIGNTIFSSQETMSDQNPLASCAYYWQLTGEQVSCEGNIETLLDCGKVANGEHPEATYECFIRLFGGWNDCPALISAPDILMETIPNMGCYHMFDGCTNLVKAPRIAATNIEYEALRGMFSGCTSLNQLPELLSTNIPSDAYSGMFSGCSSIKLSTEKTDEYKYEYRIPSTGTGTAEDGALDYMFADTGGTFTGTPEINTVYYTSNEIVRAVEQIIKPALTFDLSTLNLTTGTYNIYVTLSAEGYKDSESSNEVIYEKLGYLVPENTYFEYWSSDGESVLHLDAGEPFPQPLPDDSALVDYTNLGADGGTSQNDVNYKYSADTNSWRVWACAYPFAPSEVTIRESIGGAPVTTIDNAFWDEFGESSFGGEMIGINLELVRIPKSITSIINEAFGYCKLFKDIIYDGTIADWNKINFSDDWNAGCSAITVTCTDGTITIPAYNA